MFSELILIGTVHVDRTLTTREAFEATGRTIFRGDEGGIEAIPRGEGDVVEVLGFYAERRFGEAVRREYYERNGLGPDPRAQAELDRTNRAFFGENPHTTFFNGPNGLWYNCVFGQWNGIIQTGHSKEKRDTPPFIGVGPYDSDRTWEPGWYLGVQLN